MCRLIDGKTDRLPSFEKHEIDLPRIYIWQKTVNESQFMSKIIFLANDDETEGKLFNDGSKFRRINS